MLKLFDTYWKKRWRLEERARKKAECDLRFERESRKNEQELLDELSDRTSAQAMAIDVYQKENTKLRVENRVRMELLQQILTFNEDDEIHYVDADVLERAVEAACKEGIIEAEAGRAFQAMIRAAVNAGRGEQENG